MKWTRRLLPFAVVALAFWACESGDTGTGTGNDQVPGVPENLTATSTSGTDLVLTWSVGAGPVDPESFFIYFNDTKIASVPGTQTTYTVSSADLGTYGVSAWANGNESDKATISTVPVETTNLQVYELNSTGGPSGIYVGSNFTAQTISVCDASAPSMMDLYFTDDAPGVDVGLVYFKGAALITQDGGWPACTNPPSGQWKTAYIARTQNFSGIADPGNSQESSVFSGAAEFVFKVNVDGNWHYGYFATSAPNTTTQSVTITTFKVSPIPGFKKIQ